MTAFSNEAGGLRTSVDPGHIALLGILDGSRLRSTHALLWLASAGGMLLDGLSIFMLGIAIPLLTESLRLSGLQVALTSSLLLLGAVVGAALGGRLADRYGRKTLLVVDAVLFFAAALVCARATGAELLMVGQFLMGTAIGMDFPVGSSEIAECMPTRHRGRAMVAAMTLQAVGMLTGAGVAALLLSWGSRTSVWRLFFDSEALWAVVFLGLRLVVPESPRWLMTRGRNREAARAIRWIVREDDPRLGASAESLGDRRHVAIKPLSRPHRFGFRTLFDRAYRRRTLLATVPWFMLDIAAYGVGLFTIVLLLAMHLGSNGRGGAGSLSLLVTRGAAVDSCLLVGFLLGWWAVPRFGAVRMQIVGFAGMLAGLALLVAAPLLPESSFRLAGLLGGFMLFNLSMNTGPNSTTYLLPAELYPTNIRATGSGFSASCAKLGAALGVFLIPLFERQGGIDAVLAFLAVATVTGLAATWRFRVRGLGRSLEAHQTDTEH